MRPRTVESLYHAIPLHYLPALFGAGALYAQSVLAAQDRLASPMAGGVPEGIRPRASARRDRKLGLADYVHLSPEPLSPLLADKMRKGHPHALLVFEGAGVLNLPEIALLPYNTKAWHTRACFLPVTDAAERGAMLSRYLGGKRLQSLEILVKYGLPLTLLRYVAFVDRRERESIVRTGNNAFRDLFVTAPNLFPYADRYRPGDWGRVRSYLSGVDQSGCRGAANAEFTAIPFD